MGLREDLIALFHHRENMRRHAGIERQLHDIQSRLDKRDEPPPAPPAPTPNLFGQYGGPNIGGIRQTDSAMNDMYYRSNMEAAARAEREGRSADAESCRRTAQAFQFGGPNAVMRNLWRESEREAVQKGDFARASYCSQKAKEIGN